MVVRQWVRRFKRMFESRAVVLMYHRVADLDADPWELAVQPVNFEQQLAVLKKKFHVVSVTELVAYFKKGSIPAHCVCVTFDDGYSDNFYNALPLLQEHQCPASFFITTDLIDQKALFWWDELQDLILAPGVLPPVFSLAIDGLELTYYLQEDAVLSESKWQLQCGWIAAEAAPTRRCELYLLLWNKLRPLTNAVLQSALRAIRLWADYEKRADRLNWPLTRTQLQKMAEHPLVDMGFHTLSHPCLSYHSYSSQYQEIVQSRTAIHQLCKNATHLFTYPYGNFNDTTLEIVKAEKLTAAFSTKEATVSKRSDPYCFGRFQVKNWNGPDFERQLSLWIKKF